MATTPTETFPATDAQPSGLSVLLDQAANVETVVRHVDLVHDIAKRVMRNGVHFGTIPGTDKLTLLQPGAQVLALAFGLRSDCLEVVSELPNGHREYRVKVPIYTAAGVQLATGIGIASTMESKYRYRWGEPVDTGKPVPREYWDARKDDPKNCSRWLGGKGFVPKKDENGAWTIHKRADAKVENPDPADLYNTVAKVAFKRGFVGGMLTATATSDMFEPPADDRGPDEPAVATTVEEEDTEKKAGNGAQAGAKKQQQAAAKPAAGPLKNHRGLTRDAFNKLSDEERHAGGDITRGAAVTLVKAAEERRWNNAQLVEFIRNATGTQVRDVWQLSAEDGAAALAAMNPADRTREQCVRLLTDRALDMPQGWPDLVANELGITAPGDKRFDQWVAALSLDEIRKLVDKVEAAA